MFKGIAHNMSELGVDQIGTVKLVQSIRFVKLVLS